TASTAPPTTDGNLSTTAGGRNGCRSRRSSRNWASVQVEIASRFGDRLLVRLAERFLEAARQCVAAGLLVCDRLLEDRLAARRLLGEDALRFAQLRLVGALRLVVRHDAPEVQI